MSKFRTRIRDVGRTPGAFGFATRGAREKPRYVLVVAAATSPAEAKRALEAGADAVIVDEAEDLGAKDHPVGARLPDATAVDVKAAQAAGADFFVFDDASTHAGALAVQDIGRVLILGPDQDEQRLRAVAALDLDAVLLPADPGAVTVRDQLALRRVAGLTGATLLIEPTGQPDAAALEAWRDAGAPAVLVPAAQVAATLEAAKQVPAPRKRSGERVTPIIGVPPAGHHHDDDDDDDD